MTSHALSRRDVVALPFLTPQLACCLSKISRFLHFIAGEPNGWPHISSSHGQLDICGFPKAAQYWYRSQWLSAVNASDPGRPPIAAPAAAVTVHIAERWQAPVAPNTTRIVHVYTSAPFASLLLNGAPVAGGEAIPVPQFGWALFNISYAPGTVTAQALAADKSTVVATHSRTTWGPAVGIKLSIDAPSVDTATGTAVYADGSDVALIRATLVDSQGNQVMDASATNVTFSVASGPGLIVGCGNGDPANHEPNQAPWHTSYHGLVRAIVRVTVDAATPVAVRARRLQIDVDAGKGPRSSSILPVGQAPPSSITVSASAPGLPTATIAIPLSVDTADSPLQVAAASVSSAALQ